ncbi:hypothetical protein [uncultured Dokdonia sp.]|uniref:hypothetical protein n=1 Tax=uncultured Dokdonia sp. TaxID=575653 RepID=UPI00260B188F|nr:hypothetical protein [uncultured Dokdonia sp.]
MNKIVYLLLLMSFVCNCQNVQQDDDYLITDSFIHTDDQSEVSLTATNDNEYVIKLLMQLRDVELTRNQYTVDSLKLSLNIIRPGQFRDDGFSNVFSLNEYDYLISQKHQGYWGENIISNINSRTKNDQANAIYFSKPIYSKDGNWALVYKSSMTSSYVLVLKKENNLWTEYKTINNTITSPKVKFRSTKS